MCNKKAERQGYCNLCYFVENVRLIPSCVPPLVNGLPDYVQFLISHNIYAATNTEILTFLKINFKLLSQRKNDFKRNKHIFQRWIESIYTQQEE
jgi:hypothetical protein